MILMKKIFILFVCLMSLALCAQEFSEKTLTFSVDLTRPMEGNTLPEIQWVMPSLESTGAEEREILIEALIESNQAISDITITVKSGTRNNTQSVEVGTNVYSKVVATKVSLFDGNNEIRLTVVNAKGGKVFSTRSVTVGSGILSKMVYANRKDYALIFAVDKYDYWAPLSSPIAGAEALQKILKEDYGFVTEIVKNPSLRDIRRKLTEYESKSYASQDQLLVYFAGHGYFDKLMGYGYAVATNSVKNEKKDSYLSLAELRATLNNFKCEHILLVEDVCVADLANTKLTKSDTAKVLTQKVFANKLSIKTRKFLNNGQREYHSTHSGNLSAFTARLIDALSQGSRKPKTFTGINSNFKNLEVMSGGFGADGAESDFLFLPK